MTGRAAETELAGPHSQSFWFRISGTKLDNLHFPDGADSAGPETSL